MDFSDLYSVMLEVFAVVLLGYAIGRLKLITSQEAKGLGRFASLIALPTSLFYNMAKIDFSAVNWMFLLGIFLTKTILFVMVAVGCVVMSKLGIARAGLFAIFATQSNDFAFGLPIINNLYGKPETGFSLGDYVFLIAPISFVILNPIGFAMMEYGQSKRQGISRSALKIAWVVFRGVFTNPIVFMAMLGLIVNPIIDHNVPSLFEPLLKVISRAFDGVALFYLGLSMVGKLKPLPGLKIIIPIALIIIKLLVLPLIANQMVNALVDSDTSSGNSSTDGSDLSTFAFVYGTIPTAPALIFFANQYALEFDLLWVSFMFILAKRYRRFLHRLTLIMMATLFIASLAIVTLRSTEGYCPDNSRVVAQFWFQLVGVFGGRFAAAAVSVGLVLVYQFPHERWAKAFSVLAAISIIVPVVLTTMLVGIGSIDTSEHFACSNNSANGSEKLRFSHTGSGRFIYGNGQLILSLLVLLLCVIVCICCLVKVGRLYRKRSRQQQTSIQRDIPSDSTEIELTSVSSPVSLASSINPLTNDNLNTLPSSSLALGATTDASGIERDRSPLVLRKGSQVLKTPSFPAAVDIQSDEDRAERESMAFFEASIDEDDSVPNQQTTRHLLLILYSILSMLVGIFLLIWHLLDQTDSAVFYELGFLDGALNYGQGIVIFALFGFDKFPIFVALQRRWRRYFYNVETIYVPPQDKLDNETRTICAAFKESHLANCKREIVTDRKYRLRTYKDVFSGCQMVAWLMDANIVHDSGEAVEYGRALIRGQVIRHVKGEHDFHDIHYFYQFFADLSTVATDQSD